MNRFKSLLLIFTVLLVSAACSEISNPAGNDLISGRQMDLLPDMDARLVASGIAPEEINPPMDTPVIPDFIPEEAPRGHYRAAAVDLCQYGHKLEDGVRRYYEKCEPQKSESSGKCLTENKHLSGLTQIINRASQLNARHFYARMQLMQKEADGNNLKRGFYNLPPRYRIKNIRLLGACEPVQEDPNFTGVVSFAIGEQIDATAMVDVCPAITTYGSNIGIKQPCHHFEESGSSGHIRVKYQASRGDRLRFRLEAAGKSHIVTPAAAVANPNNLLIKVEAKIEDPMPETFYAYYQIEPAEAIAELEVYVNGRETPFQRMKNRALVKAKEGDLIEFKRKSTEQKVSRRHSKNPVPVIFHEVDPPARALRVGVEDESLSSVPLGSVGYASVIIGNGGNRHDQLQMSVKSESQLFTITKNTCSDSLKPGESCRLQIVLKGAKIGSHRAILSVRLGNEVQNHPVQGTVLKSSGISNPVAPVDNPVRKETTNY